MNRSVIMAAVSMAVALTIGSTTVSVSAVTLSYDASLNTLPSAQGWTYTGIGEGATFSATSGTLQQSTMDTGYGGQYQAPIVCGDAFSVAFRASVTASQQTGGLAGTTPLCPYGFGLDARVHCRFTREWRLSQYPTF